MKILLSTYVDLAEVEDTGLPYLVHLDRKDTAVPDGSLQFTIPDWLLTDENIVVVQSDDCNYPGLTVQVDDVTAGVVTLKTDPGGTIIYGTPYTSSYKPTMPLIKDQNGIAVETNPLIINTMNVSYKDTGWFNFDVIDPWADTTTQIFSARIAGGIQTIVGEQPIAAAGKFTGAVSKDRDQAEVEINTNSHLPMSLVDIEWTGQFTKVGRRF